MEINSTTYLIEPNYSTTGDTKSDTVKFLTFMDGSMEVLNYGSRVENEAEFAVLGLSNIQFVTLTDYLIASAGAKILIKLGDGEELFPNVAGGGVGGDEFYVYVLEPKNHQEQDFSTTRELFTLKVKVALAGTTSGAVPNEADTSLIDICIDIDTVIADDTGGSEPGTPSIGDRWLDTAGNEGDANGLYKCIDSDGAAFADRWKYLYTVYADDSDYGFKDGVFHVSAFADVSQNLSGNPDNIPYDYISGLINYKSIKFPRKNINLNDGPGIERREGFSLSVKNGGKFWNFINTNSIGILGSKCTMTFMKIDGVNEYFDKITTAKLRNIVFSYTDYVLKAEPFVLNDKGKFPTETIDSTESRYTDVKADEVDKPIYRTYGQHNVAALQNVSTDRIEVKATKRFNSSIGGEVVQNIKAITAQIEFNDDNVLYIRKTVDDILSSYVFEADTITDMGNTTYTIKVTADSQSSIDDSNIGEIREVTVVDNVGDADYLILTLDSDLPYGSTSGGAKSPGTNDTIVIFINKYRYQHQIDEDVCGGFGTINSNGDYDVDRVTLYQLDDNEKELIEVPNTEYEINADKNLIVLNPKAAEDSSTVTSFKPVQDNVLNEGNIQTPERDDLAFGDYYDVPAFGLTPDSSFDRYTIARSDLGYGQLNPFLWTAEDINTSLLCCAAVRAGITATNIHNIQVRYNTDPAGTNKVLSEHTSVLVFRFPKEIIPTETALSNSDNIRLCVDFSITSVSESDDSGKTSGHNRKTSAGFHLKIRFKKYDGTYVENVADAWKHEFNRSELGVDNDGTENQGKIRINNFPDGDLTGGFKEDTTTLTDLYDYEVTAKGDSKVDLGSNTSIRVKGDLGYVNENGGGDAKQVFTWDGSSWGNSQAVSTGERIYENHRNDPSLSFMYEVESSGALTLLTDGVDFNSLPDYNGRDLFDLTDDLFEPSAGVWADVESMELIISNKDLENNWNTPTVSGSDSYRQRWRYWNFNIELNNTTPKLYEFEEIDVADKVLFSAVQGQTVGDYPTKAEDIAPDLMDRWYPNQWESTSLTTLMNLVTRYNWYWRRQFTEQMTSQESLKELLLNLWACAVINEDDKIEFKSLNPDDHKKGSPIKTFNETNILADTVKNPKFRDLDKVFNKVVLNVDYNIASEFSNALKEYNITYINDENNGTTQIKRYCEISNIIFKVENTKTLDLKYHYYSDGTDDDSIYIRRSGVDLHDWATKWFVLNVWEIKFKVSISNMIGNNTLKLMDYVAVNTDFFSNDEDMEGFVYSLTPNPYDGFIEVGVFVYKPPGVFGGLCDNFKDALTTDRDISSWGSSKKNDAGTTSRNIGDYTIHDAGTTDRTLEC